MTATSLLLVPYTAHAYQAALPPELLRPLQSLLSDPLFLSSVTYFHTHQSTLLTAFGVYSTAVFLLLSMRLNSAIKVYTDASAAFGDMNAQISSFAHQTQLYLTDKRVSTEASLWAYALARSVQTEMHRVTGEESRAMYEHLLLRHRPPPIPEELSGAATALRGAAEAEAAGGAAASGAPLSEEQAKREASLAFILGEVEQRARVEALIRAPSPSIFCLQQLTAQCRVAFDCGIITNIRALIAIHGSVEKMQLAHAACQRVQLTPEPYSYASLMKTSSVLWTSALPFVLMPTLSFATVPVCGILSFFVCKIDEISAELQNPYGYDISDVGMGAINSRLQAEIAQSVLLYNHFSPGDLAAPWDVSGKGNAMDEAIDSKEAGAVKLGLKGVGDWKDNEKLWKAAGLGGREAVYSWPASP